MNLYHKYNGVYDNGFTDDFLKEVIRSQITPIVELLASHRVPLLNVFHFSAKQEFSF